MPRGGAAQRQCTAALGLLLLLWARAAGEGDAGDAKTYVRGGTAKLGAFQLPVYAVSGFKKGSAIQIEAGTETEKRVIASIEGKHPQDYVFILEQGLKFEHEAGELVVLLADGELSSTETTDEALKGDKSLPVETTDGFQSGQSVQIISDAGTELRTIVVNSDDNHHLFLDKALEHAEPPGTEVVGAADAPPPPVDGKLTSEGMAEAKDWLKHSKASRMVTEETLKVEATAGDDSLSVSTVVGFEEGDSVMIANQADRRSEVREIREVDAISRVIYLKAELEKSYDRGSTVSKLEEHILGEYGFISQFDGIDEEEARRRVRRLASVFGVREFEFYNAFEGYSYPPSDSKKKWNCACLGTPVRRSLLRAYTDEISKQGGRSWLAVVGMATDPGDTEAQEGTYTIGQQVVEEQVLLDVVEPTGELASKIAPRWANFAEGLGFNGIHWATVNGYGTGGAARKEPDVKEFLRASKLVLKDHGLEQTWNFLNGFGWDRQLVSDGIVAFTVWEPFDHMTDPFQALGAGVVKSFPAPDGDSRNVLDDVSDTWARARCNGLQLLAVGDGSRILRNDYYPSALKMSDEDVNLLNERVFGELACSTESLPVVRGVLLAKTDGVDASALLSAEHQMVEGVLLGLFGYKKCHLVAWREAGASSEVFSVHPRRRLADDKGKQQFEIPFLGQCGGACVDAASVSQSEIRNALQQGFQRHGIDGRVTAASVLWGPKGGRNSFADDIDGEGKSNGGNNLLLYAVLCLLVVIVLCMVLIFLELFWQRQLSRKDEGPRRSYAPAFEEDYSRRRDVLPRETDPLAREETVLAPDLGYDNGGGDRPDLGDGGGDRGHGLGDPAPDGDDTTRVQVTVETGGDHDGREEHETVVHVEINPEDDGEHRQGTGHF